MGRQLAAQRAFRARHAGHARIGFDGHPQRAGRGFEDRFGDVVAVAAVVHEHVQIAQRVGGDGLPKILDQFAVEVADLWDWESALETPRSSGRSDRCAVVTSVSSIGSVKWP